MKKIILLFYLLLLIGKTYCQVLPNSTSKGNFTKAYYLHKSKKQKAGARLSVSAGVAIAAMASLYASNNLDFRATRKRCR